jgi:hypothetical protein
MVSIFYGFARDAFTFTFYDLDKELIDKVAKSEITKIIDTVNVKKATDVWDNILKPFYKNNIPHNTPFQDDKVIACIDEMIKNGGYTHLFNPMNMLHYWAYRSPNPVEKIGWDRTFGIQGFLGSYDAKLMKAIKEEE